MNTNYAIVYKPSFILMWGSALALGFYFGGWLMLAYTAVAILMLVHHEYSHIRECEKRGVKINNVTFNWLGGMVDADIFLANDIVPILEAGVKNTGYYALGFGSVLFTTLFISNSYVVMPLAGIHYIRFLESIVLFSIIMLVCNVLPISIRSKKYGFVSTDGWAALRYRELRDELWNEGAHIALDHLNF
jgi:hypothetical protein